jgi:peptidoglycan/xylan/chitin deacetylase (PgdA/CDA1 family)
MPTRFHITLLVSALLAVVLVALSQFILLGTIIAALFILIGLGVAFPQMSFFGPYVCRGDTSRRCVEMTFDDGPDARSTPALLDLLQEQKIEAAFFGVGKRVAANPELSARISREGHLLENHSFAHSNATNFYTAPRLKIELAQAQAVVQQATGSAPKLFRPPMGLSNPNVFRAARELGLTVVGWSVRSLDTQIKNPERLVARITRRLAPGAIILLHDGNIPAVRLVMTVKLLLIKLKESGYEVVRLDKMLK